MDSDHQQQFSAYGERQEWCWMKVDDVDGVDGAYGDRIEWCWMKVVDAFICPSYQLSAPAGKWIISKNKQCGHFLSVREAPIKNGFIWDNWPKCGWVRSGGSKLKKITFLWHSWHKSMKLRGGGGGGDGFTTLSQMSQIFPFVVGGFP